MSDAEEANEQLKDESSAEDANFDNTPAEETRKDS